MNILSGSLISQDKPFYEEATSKFQTEEFKQFIPESSYESGQKYAQDYAENTQKSGGSSYGKENEMRRGNYDTYTNSKVSKAGKDPVEQVYYSGKNYQDRSLEYTGSYKMKTSIKNKPDRDLATLNIDKIDKESVNSPISYQSNMYVEDNKYYESKGRSTFQRNPYE
mmetsp:Transcript_8982/g.7985  ORF Transcript_8982/g.7985 Transcript_8982/m.7985 type:complete len:167 (+) Transcript_8982:1550-2050(+)